MLTWSIICFSGGFWRFRETKCKDRMVLHGANTDDSANNVDKANKIFAKYGDFINTIIRHKVKNEAQADDLYQDFFLSLVSNPVPPNVQDVKAYLYRAITHDVIDTFRRIQRDEILMNKYAENIKFPINKPSSTNAFYIERKASNILSLIRGRLNPTQAKAIILRYKDNCSNEEIAKQIGVKKESVSRYICVGLKQIQQILAEEGNIKK